MAVVDVQELTAQAVCQELSAKGVRSIAVTADVTNAKDCQRWVLLQPPRALATHVCCSSCPVKARDCR